MASTMYGTPMVSSVMPNPMGTPMMSTIMPNSIDNSGQTIISLLNNKSTSDGSFAVISNLLDENLLSTEITPSVSNQLPVRRFDTNIPTQNIQNEMNQTINSYQNYVDSVIQTISPAPISLPEEPTSIIEKNRTELTSTSLNIDNTRLLTNPSVIQTELKNIDVNLFTSSNRYLELSDTNISQNYENIQPTNTYSIGNISSVVDSFSNNLVQTPTNQFGSTGESVPMVFVSNTYSQLPTNKFYTR